MDFHWPHLGENGKTRSIPRLLESFGLADFSSPGVEDPWPETSHLFHAAAFLDIWMMVFLLMFFLEGRCQYLDVPGEWPFQEKMEVPTIYNGNIPIEYGQRYGPNVPRFEDPGIFIEYIVKSLVNQIC